MNPVPQKNKKWINLNINLLLVLLLNLSWEFNIKSKSLGEFKINIVKNLLKNYVYKIKLNYQDYCNS